MPLSLPVDLALLGIGLVSTFVTGLALRRRKAWPAALLLLVPPIVCVGGADLVLRLLVPLRPTWVIDGSRADVLRHVGFFLLLWIPVELVHQRTVTRLARGGVERRPAPPTRDPPPSP